MRYVVREHPVPRQGETGMAYVRRLENWLNKDRTPLELVTITSHELCVFVDRRKRSKVDVGGMTFAVVEDPEDQTLPPGALRIVDVETDDAL